MSQAEPWMISAARGPENAVRLKKEIQKAIAKPGKRILTGLRRSESNLANGCHE